MRRDCIVAGRLRQTEAARALALLDGRLRRNPPPEGVEAVLDIDSSLDRCRYMLSRSPCLLKSRDQGYWLWRRRCRMSLAEQLRRQGIDECLPVVIQPQKLSQMIGNTTSQNVVERLLARLLPVVGLAEPMVIRDRYAAT